MNWLKTLGTILMKGVQLVTGIVPLLTPILPSAVQAKVQEYSDDFTKIAQVVITAEQMFAQAFGTDTPMGQQKLAATVPYVMQIILASEIFHNKKVKDQNLLNAAATDMTNGMVKAFAAFEG